MHCIAHTLHTNQKENDNKNKYLNNTKTHPLYYIILYIIIHTLLFALITVPASGNYFHLLYIVYFFQCVFNYLHFVHLYYRQKYYRNML